MHRQTDVRVHESSVRFHDVGFTRPLHLSGATVDRFSLAEVHVLVEDGAGRRARGRGTTVLSVPWSWPNSDSPWEQRDRTLRTLTERLANAAVGLPRADPLTLYDELAALGPKLAAATAADHVIAEEIPALATALTLGAVDNAVHDGWAQAAGAPAMELYTPGYVPIEPGVRFAHGRTRLPVQHVVSLGDPLADGSAGDPSLADWIRADGIRHVKVKLAGRGPDSDAAWVAAVHRELRSQVTGDISLSLDPNEAYQSATDVAAMIDALRAQAPAAFADVTHVEQPVPRDAPPDPDGMRAVADRVPVILDEGLTGVDSLASIAADGWSGLAIKAARGQTLALRSYAHAQANGLFMTMQDLTAVGPALAHSARLASALVTSTPTFEYNSRQYAAAANAELARYHPELVRVHDGHITVGEPRHGLY